MTSPTEGKVHLQQHCSHNINPQASVVSVSSFMHASISTFDINFVSKKSADTLFRNEPLECGVYRGDVCGY